MCREYRVCTYVHFNASLYIGHIDMISINRIKKYFLDECYSQCGVCKAVELRGYACRFSCYSTRSRKLCKLMKGNQRTGTWPDIAGPGRSALLTPNSCLLRSFRSQSRMHPWPLSPSFLWCCGSDFISARVCIRTFSRRGYAAARYPRQRSNE